jgi:glycosyltransferase involved in cell wall biosynthesis
METVPFKKDEKLTVHGFVDDLSEFYKKSDCVVSPILTGSGMKTKTTEALMWGKYIIGSEEAFVGFDVTPLEGSICRNANDYIKVINGMYSIEIKNYCDASRKLYLDKYSLDSSVRVFKKIMEAK